MSKVKFRVKAGSDVRGTGEDEKTYAAGSIIESDDDAEIARMDAERERYERVHEDRPIRKGEIPPNVGGQPSKLSEGGMSQKSTGEQAGPQANPKETNESESDDSETPPKTPTKASGPTVGPKGGIGTPPKGADKR